MRLMKIALIVMLGMNAWVLPAIGQTFFWTGFGSDGNWSNPNNWSGNVAPTPGPNVVLQFNPGAANFNMVNDYTTPNWNQLVFAAPGYTLNGNSLTFVQSTSAVLPQVLGVANTIVPINWVLDDHLTFIGNAGTESFLYSGTMSGAGNLNLSGGFTLQAGGAINNAGAINISTNSGTVFINGTVGNGGDLSIDNNRVLAGTGTINRNLIMPGAADITSSEILTVNGNIQVTSPSNRLLAGTLDANGLFAVSGGNFSVQSGAILAGAGNVQVSGGGGMSVHGTVAGSKTIELTGLLNPVLLAGTGTIHGNVIVNGDHFVANSGSLTFNGNTVFANTTNQAFLGTLFGSFTNNGIMTVTGTATVRLEGNVNSTSSGSISVDNGGALRLTGNQFDANSNLFSHGTVTVLGASTVNGSVGLFDGGVLNLNGQSLNANLVFNSNGNASIINSGTLTVGSLGMNVESGNLSVASGVVVNGTSALTIDSGANLINSGSINLNTTVRGTLDGGAGSLINNPLTAENAILIGLLNVQNTFNVQTTGISQLQAGGSLIVAGATSVTDGGLILDTGSFMNALGNMAVTNNALLNVNGTLTTGLLNMDSTTVLRGSGLISGNLFIDGMLDPGNSAGTLGLDGSIDLGSTTTIRIEIGGTTPGSQYDRLDGRGFSTISLNDATLELMLIDGFTPTADDEFEFLFDFGSITGTFGNHGGSGGGGFFTDPRIFFAGGSFAIEYGSSSVRLFDFQPVPEPSSAVFVMLVGVVVLSRRSTRRRLELV
ncbi:MAG TPA: hypothetical protein PKD64_16710 [Pirellulaceae bacterium]|nr:hypothetical protein [Pirellulaceae bacterium]HMO93829.1 hypothetical protein [Pirellulaceae bacterium]HMP71366.1 hypothetical protein [Pirellulaceae bacterium]